MNESIAAVVVTFNRKQLLMECLDALLDQIRRPDRIILIDNASTDGTRDLLQAKGFLENELVEYVLLPENTGGAGGFHEGIKRAYEEGFDWIWVMDDDAEPMKDALANMAEYFAPDVVAVANLKVGEDGFPQYQHRGWFDFRRNDERVIRELTPSDMENLTVQIEHASFVGLAISRSAVSKIGYPKREFFIHYDDVEYCARLRDIGKIIMVTRSIIMHKDARKSAMGSIAGSFMGRSSERVPFDKLWLTYYGARNRIWLKKEYGSLHSTLLSSLSWLTRRCVGVLLYDDYKVERVWFYLNAVCDGILGRFDNQKPKRLLTLGSETAYKAKKNEVSTSQAKINYPSTDNTFCVTVTYGERRALLRQVLDALPAQGVSRAVVVDNGARWPVQDELAAAYGDFVDVVEMGRNTGSAGGFAAGIRRALETGAEYIWLLDDDNRPAPDCLAALGAAYQDLRRQHPADLLAVLAFRPEHQADVAAGVPLRYVNPRRNSFRGFHVLNIPYKFWQRTPWGRPRVRGDLPAHVDLLIATYSGLFFHRALVERFGLPRADFVLYADDIEYSHRIVRAGGRIALITTAAIEDLESSWDKRQHQGGSSFSILLGQGSDLRVYYSTRNSVYLDAHCRAHDRLMFTLNRWVYMAALATLARRGGQHARLAVIQQAVRDGLAGHLGMHKSFPL